MTTEEESNKAVIGQLVEAFNSKNREAFDACYADPIVIHSQHGDFTMTHDEHWESVEQTFAAFPDLRADLLGVIAEGDHVYQYWTYTGTHHGEIAGRIPPTDRRAEWRAFSDYRLVDGKIVEATQIHDRLEQYLQLGLIQLPGT